MIQDERTQDPATIERDIRRTQDDMSRTVDKIGDQLTARNLFNAMLDKADENGIDAEYLIDGARRNPVALGLIAAGAIWLVSDKNAKFPSSSSDGHKSDRRQSSLDSSDMAHEHYVSHMSSLDWRDGEDPATYQRRRDMHRATFLMCERKPDEDDRSFRDRLDHMTDSLRQKRQDWMDSAGRSGSAAMDRTSNAASQAASRTQELFEDNPLVGGLLAAALGAAIGSAVPVSRTEQEQLGNLGAKAREKVSEGKDQLTSKAMEKEGQLADKADQRLQRAHSRSQDQSNEGQEPAFAGAGSQSSGGLHRSSSEGPFIITDRKS